MPMWRRRQPSRNRAFTAGQNNACRTAGSIRTLLSCRRPIPEIAMARILVVDDQKDVRAMIAIVLRVNRFEVVEA